MNAGGVLNTCKSNGARLAIDEFSGERVRNALVTCPEEGDNGSKGLLIPHVVLRLETPVLEEQFASGGTCVSSASW